MISKIKKIVEYIIVFVLLLILCFYVNKSIEIKALYMDDLYSWSWFPGLNIFEYAFKFYGESRYRPIFDVLQYIEYYFVNNKVYLFAVINKTINALVALFIYHFAIRVNAKKIIAFMVAAMYIISHFSYYQIGQVIGLIETEAQFFALVILFLSLKLTGVIKTKNVNTIKSVINKNNLSTFLLLLLYLIIAFTHERYLSMILVIIIAIFFAEDVDKKNNKYIFKYRLYSYISLFLILLLICFIRLLAIGKVLPAGTGGTRVENTFNILQCLKFCVHQVFMIFGINIGPEHLVGIEFTNIPNIILKYMTYVSNCILIIIVIISLVYKFIKISHSNNRINAFRIFIPDILFLVFIAMCIGASSVTIRVEMRFVFASFSASLLYLSYISGFFLDKFKDANKIASYVLINFVVFLALSLRLPIELTYRDYYKNIHFFVDLDRVNSIYDNTIGKYGVYDILKNKTVYMTNNFFGFTDFYAEWFYKIYDTRKLPIEEKGKKIILIKDVTDLPQDITNENSVVLFENINTFRDYYKYDIEN